MPLHVTEHDAHVQAYGQRESFEPGMELQAAVLNQETLAAALQTVTHYYLSAQQRSKLL